ncbi:MAG: hypothetical protein GWP91_12885 [Rhodobacterales bacterium]|nr:hypothetical protein [Rhodobacterales bacterium]
MSLFLLLFACHGVTETGDAGMVGRLLDAGGQPISDVVVRTVEAEFRTDAEGEFAVGWKKPDHYVFFTHQGLFYQRTWQDGEGGILNVHLPATRGAELTCPAEDTALTLLWSIPPGLEVRRTQKCTSGAVIHLGQIPESVPIVQGEADSLTLYDDGTSIRVVAVGVP